MASRRPRNADPGPEVLDDPRELQRIEHEPEPPPAIQMPEDRIAGLLQDVGGDPKAQVRITRINARTGEREFCGRLTPTEFENGDMDLIRETWGAGKYEVALYGTVPETGYSGRRGVTIINIAESSRPLNPGAAPRGDSDMAQVLRAIMEGQQQQTAALMSMANKPAPDMLATMMGALPLILQLKELFGAGKQTPLLEQLELMKAIKEHAGEFTGDGGGKSDLAEMVSVGKPLIEMVQSALANRAQQQSQPVMMPAAQVPPRLSNPIPRDGVVRAPGGPFEVKPAAPFAPATIQQQSDKESDVNTAHQIMFKVLLNRVVQLAKAHTPEAPTTEAAADLLCEKLPDEFLELIEDDALWWDALGLMLEPFGVGELVTTHETWLREVRELMVAEVEGEQEPGRDAPFLVPVAGPPGV